MPDVKTIGYKVIFTIIKKGWGPKVVKAAKLGGAEGSTTMFGLGTAPPGTYTIWGIDMEPEKEIVLTLVPDSIKESVFKNIRRIAKLHKRGTGICLVLDVMRIAGCVHLGKQIIKTSDLTNTNAMKSSENNDLIVTVVSKGQSGLVIEASREAGAEGGTIMGGRGSGIHEKASIFSINIEPEKEIVLTLVRRNITEKVLKNITDKAGLNESGKGIAFVLPVEEIAGINHPIGVESAPE
jgi:nitrogen regulatory protein PII